MYSCNILSGHQHLSKVRIDKLLSQITTAAIIRIGLAVPFLYCSIAVDTDFRCEGESLNYLYSSFFHHQLPGITMKVSGPCSSFSFVSSFCILVSS